MCEPIYHRGVIFTQTSGRGDGAPHIHTQAAGQNSNKFTFFQLISVWIFFVALTAAVAVLFFCSEQFEYMIVMN